MPYRRRYRRRPYRRRYRRRARAPTYGQIGRKVYGDVMWLKKKISKLNVEVKRHDVNSSGTVPQNAVSLNPIVLSSIAQGDTDVTRDGNSIKCTGLDLRFRFNQPATSADQQIRIAVVMLKRAGIATLTTDEVFETPANSMSFRNIDKSRPIKVLYDHFFDVDIATKDFFTKTLHIPLRHHIKWDNSSGSSDQYGGLGVFIWTSVSTNREEYELESRLRYVDN